jgi:hypothetical protein
MFCDRSNRLLSAGIPQWIRRQPLHNIWNRQLKAPWNVKTDESAPDGAAILKSVGGTTRDQLVRTPHCMGPLAINDNAHRSFNHIEDMILWVRVGSGACRIGVKPPLRHGVARIRFYGIRFENGAHSTH